MSNLVTMRRPECGFIATATNSPDDLNSRELDSRIFDTSRELIWAGFSDGRMSSLSIDFELSQPAQYSRIQAHPAHAPITWIQIIGNESEAVLSLSPSIARRALPRQLDMATSHAAN